MYNILYNNSREEMFCETFQEKEDLKYEQKISTCHRFGCG